MVLGWGRSDTCYTRTYLGRQETSFYRREQILLQESKNVWFQPGVQSHPVLETAGSWLDEMSNGGTLRREKQLWVLYQLIHGGHIHCFIRELKANYSTCNRKTADLDTKDTTNAYRLCWQRASEDNAGTLFEHKDPLAAAEMLWANQQDVRHKARARS